MDETTTDHDTIRRWIEAHGGLPAAVKNTLAGDQAGVLFIDFPGYTHKDVDEISWETFFKTFDQQRLAFTFRDDPALENPYHACALVARETGEPVMAQP